MSIIEEVFGEGQRPEASSNITYGLVVDTNDPFQMGRLRVYCPGLNDTKRKKLKHIPWATYAAPFAGITEKGSRGRNDDISTGPVAYGMWNIPKVGATVLVACIDGDTSVRVWLGCIHNQLLSHTMPHGRFSYNDQLVTDSGFEWDDDTEGKPLGPFTSQEERIEPTYSQLVEAFTTSQDTIGVFGGDTVNPQVNFEWRTRGADHSVSGVSAEVQLSGSSTTSFVSDDKDLGDGTNDRFIETDGNILVSERIEQGYKRSRIDPDKKFDATEKNYDSQVHAWSTPGFHAIAMDDSSTNCRMRFRTTHGHQIILDDTNERIYISTAGGKTWVEMDEKGNMDFYAERNISFHTEKDFNITADNIRMKAKSGIHMASEGEVRMHSSGDDAHLTSDKNVRIHSGLETRVHAEGNLHLKTDTVAYFSSVGEMNLFTDAAGKFTSGAKLSLKGADASMEGTATANVKGGTANVEGDTAANVKSAAVNVEASGIVALVGSTINLNSGGSAGSATPADVAIAAMATVHKNAFWTNRVPEHEPWPRVMTDPAVTDQDTGNTHANSAEYAYDDPDVGRVERGDPLDRNKNWHR